MVAGEGEVAGTRTGNEIEMGSERGTGKWASGVVDLGMEGGGEDSW